MTAQELIAKQVSQTEFMLQKTFEGLDEESASKKVGPMMSPKETVEHLCECYLAAKAHAKGEKFEWGQYSAPDKSWNGLLEEFQVRRKDVLESLSGSEDEVINVASDFMVGHDHYHVGQLCAIRLALDPEWNYYSIYG